MTVTASCSGLTSATVTIVVKKIEDPTAIGIHQIGPVHTGNGEQTTIRPMIGNRMHLPRSNPQSKRIVSIYDLRGRCVFDGVISERTVDFGKTAALGYKMYIVKIREIKMKPADK